MGCRGERQALEKGFQLPEEEGSVDSDVSRLGLEKKIEGKIEPGSSEKGLPGQALRSGMGPA